MSSFGLAPHRSNRTSFSSVDEASSFVNQSSIRAINKYIAVFSRFSFDVCE